jgi:hypothetical protein
MLTIQAYVTGNSEVRQAILKSMATPHDASNPEAQLTAGSIILSGLLDLPIGGQEFDPYRPLSSSLLLSHLIRHSKECKELAHAIRLPSGDGDDDDETVPLLQLIVGNLMMASREQAEAASRAAKEGTESFEEEDWTRVMVGYLVLLSTWLWDSPKSVAEFLSESANMQVVSRDNNSTCTYY